MARHVEDHHSKTTTVRQLCSSFGISSRSPFSVCAGDLSRDRRIPEVGRPINQPTWHGSSFSAQLVEVRATSCRRTRKANGPVSTSWYRATPAVSLARRCWRWSGSRVSSWRRPSKFTSSLVCKHDAPALDLLDVETHQRFAMWAVDRERADGSKPKVWIIAAEWRFLKCNKASARRVGAPDCQIPLPRRRETVDRWAGDVVDGTIPLACCPR
jgi:hypothetical protein